MTSQQTMEIQFWRELYKQLGNKPETFLAQREADWKDIADHFSPLAKYLSVPKEDVENVLEVGTGMISPLEFSEGADVNITGIDPLVGAYQDTIEMHGRNVRYLEQSGEAIAFDADTFDAVVCINVIDHTPNPDVMMQEIRRVLKPGGKLFFEVNYDSALSPAHYGLWDDAKVDTMMKDGWKMVDGMKDERKEHGQIRFWGVYEKV